MQLKRLVSGVILVLLVASAAQAADEGRIEGIIKLADGTGLGGVSVVVSETGASTLTDNSGRFAFAHLPPGTYTISFTSGDNQLSEPGVTIAAGETTHLDKTVDWDVSIVETITVYSASRQRERVVDAPAAVTTVTEKEIERQAAHGQVPKLLEFTPGAEVTQSGIYDFNFNTRGFNSSINRRVATLIDGRDPSAPFLGAQEWAAISFPLDELESAELVRGPSSALYGANAYNGVLNLTTKSARESQGTAVRLTAGELSTTNLDVRWGGELGNEWYLKVTAGLRDHGDFAVSRDGEAEYSEPCPVPQGSATDCLPQEFPLERPDDDEVRFGSIRLDKFFANGHVLTVEGGTADVEGPVIQTGIGRVQVLDVDRPWARVNYSTDHLNFLGYYNKRDAEKQLSLSAGTNFVLDNENYQIEVQGNWMLANEKIRLVVGGTYGEEDIDSLDPETDRQTVIFEPIESDQKAAYAQVDFNLTDHLKLVAAGRWDDSSLHDPRFSPKGAIVYSVNQNHAVRLTYNEAFQVPNYSEFFLQADVAPSVNLAAVEPICTFNGGGAPVDCGFGDGMTRVLALGNEDLELEEVQTLELGYSGIIAGRSYLTVDIYGSRNEKFISDLIPQLGTSLGRINPNFGPYEAPSGLTPVAEATLLGTLMFALGPSFAALSNNLDGSPLFAAASYTNFGEVESYGAELGFQHQLAEKCSTTPGSTSTSRMSCPDSRTCCCRTPPRTGSRPESASPASGSTVWWTTAGSTSSAGRWDRSRATSRGTARSI